jgi:hypothetical protein
MAHGEQDVTKTEGLLYSVPLPGVGPVGYNRLVTASERGVKEDVIEALEENGFVSIKNDWRKWRDRNDLFDYVIMKSVVFCQELTSI